MIETAPFGATGHDSSRVIFGAAALGSVVQGRRRPGARRPARARRQPHRRGRRATGTPSCASRRGCSATPDTFFLATKTGRADLPRRAGGDPALARPARRRPGRLDPAAQPGRRHRVGHRAERGRRPGGGDRGARGGPRPVHRRHRARPVGARDAPAQPGALRLRLGARARTTTCRCRTRATPRRSRRWPPSAPSGTSRCRRSRASPGAAGTAASTPRRPGTSRCASRPTSTSRSHWVLGRPEAFLLTTGDVEILPRLLDAAERFERRPSDEEMAALAARAEAEPLFV